MKTTVKRVFLFVAVVTTITILSGCQAESTTPAPPANSTANNAAPAGGPMKRPTSQMGTGAMAAPPGTDTSLKGGMK